MWEDWEEEEAVEGVGREERALCVWCAARVDYACGVLQSGVRV